MLILAIGDLHIPERAVDIPHKFKKLLQPTGKIQQVLCLGNVTNSQSTLDFLKSLSLDFQIVKGDLDQDYNLPLSLVFSHDKLKVGLLNGFQIVPKADPLSLLSQARLMDVDILIYGSTHKVEAYTLDGRFFVNPGSATGAFSTSKMDQEDVDTVEAYLAEVNGKRGQGEEKKETNSEDKDGNGDKNEEEKLESGKPEEPVEIGEYMDPVPSFCLLDIQGSVCTLYLYTLIEGEVKVDKLTYRKEEQE
ncbi:hypothetical protein KL930_004418 [Ogataea haglerorum]|uniref:Vacuolar protein sorting-associated protein 29 n=1 Tax=Ogataea haglerorum TaxID=1937702 RepID=A0AAN6D3B4_9ASCO|nr:uncharacterized protein KL911_004772 [Ogataea haglerorum]KAG7692834.1 hypothetical protein KL951_004845 [Ogataea haglerorum]KAG7703545.1 hypothetical protein KL950_004773 [Ogataea haglerorum]KAG7703891.1 hypothetical protein KL914_004382 [Ogataea haglerorum]KAG7715511.1 hypothetical protein KL913_003846 [Ogataea haglerorum]KAG7716033.1 hypothetical protein KL949_003928 [Ogataea haglerorum]